MIHFNQQTFSESPSVETSPHAASIISSNDDEGCRECLSTCVLCRRISNHLQPTTLVPEDPLISLDGLPTTGSLNVQQTKQPP